MFAFNFEKWSDCLVLFWIVLKKVISGLNLFWKFEKEISWLYFILKIDQFVFYFENFTNRIEISLVYDEMFLNE